MRYLDCYGYHPRPDKRYRSCCGCVFTLWTIVTILGIATYFLHQYATEPYALLERRVALDPDLVLSPSSFPPFPEVGVSFRLRNGSVFQSRDVLEVQFRQRYAVNGFQTLDPELQRLRLPVDKCKFLGHTDASPTFESVCPKYGNMVNREDSNGFSKQSFVPSSRDEAVLPQIQGEPLGERYSALEAAVVANLEKIEAIPDLSVVDIFKGDIVVHIGTRELQLVNRDIRSEIHKEYKLFTRRFSAKQYTLPKVDVEFSLRRVHRRSSFADTDSLQNTHFDVILNRLDGETDDMWIVPKYTAYNAAQQLLEFSSDISEGVKTPQRFPIAQIYFRMSPENFQITMQPYATILDVFGAIGGAIALALTLCGLPALCLNCWLFQRALKIADEDGLIPGSVYDTNGNIKKGRHEEVIDILNGRPPPQLQPIRTLKSVSIGSFHFRTSLPKPEKKPSGGESIFQW